MLVLLISCGNRKYNAFAKANTPPAKSSKKATNDLTVLPTNAPITVGANQTELYLPLLKDKRVGIVTNQSGLIFKTVPHQVDQSTHLVDSLLTLGVSLKKVYSPEHGFRGKSDAGAQVKDSKDLKSGLPIISLHGKSRKPSAAQLQGIDILLFDIQDVGVRFYTYISTLTNVMEAAAQQGLPIIVLDRPNPNAHYIDGPTLEKEHSSFLGMHEVPLVYGMTIGEYAKMVNGERWLDKGLQADLKVISLLNWSYVDRYSLPTRPSPNLPNDQSINLYPSLGFFEGTTINAGRGTEMQFQVVGAPDFDPRLYPFSYTPVPNFGASNPKHRDALCYGFDLRAYPYMSYVNLEWLIEAYTASSTKAQFFKTASFTLHAGNETLQQQIVDGYTFKEIKKSWYQDIEKFKKTRAKYLLYER